MPIHYLKKMDNLTKYHREKLTPVALESLDRVLPGELSVAISALGLDFPTQLQQHFNDGLDLSLLVKMLRMCPICNASVNFLSLRAMPLLGEYTNPDDRAFNLSQLQPRITKQEWVRSNFQSMYGSIASIYQQMRKQVDFFGHSVAEIVCDDNQEGYPFQWRLTKLKILEIDRYYFAGRGGEVDRVIYYTQHHPPRSIPIGKLLVMYNPSAENPNDPYGDCAAARAYPYYLARQILSKNWTVASQTQATGHPIFKAPSNENTQLLDSRGNPLKDDAGKIRIANLVYATAEAVRTLKNGEPLVVDKRVDVSTLSTSNGQGFWKEFDDRLKNDIFMCWGIPSTIFTDAQSALGGDGINKGHMIVVDAMVKASVERDRQSIVEKIFRPLLMANFGKDATASLGEFETTQYPDPAVVGIQLSNIMQATMQGALDVNDLQVKNKIEALCGLPETSREDYDNAQLAKYQLEQAQAIEAQPTD
jgi:hypothetical protein